MMLQGAFVDRSCPDAPVPWTATKRGNYRRFQKIVKKNFSGPVCFPGPAPGPSVRSFTSCSLFWYNNTTTGAEDIRARFRPYPGMP